MSMIKIIKANTFLKKTIGLMGKKNINYGMFFPNVNSIHTFFMTESIDLIGLNKEMIITEIIPNVNKNRIIILSNSKHTLELPNNYSKNFKIGQKIKL